MSRRGPKSPVLPSRTPRPEPIPREDEIAFDEIRLAWLGERLRRVALGATVALLTARAFWPSEPDLRTEAGGGLGWVLAILTAFGLAIAGAMIGGTLRLRWSWADLGVIALVSLVAMSSMHAIDRRPALNLSWEWLAFGFAYLMIRNLPRTRGESIAIGGALVATAVSVAVYGLYQVVIELPQVRLDYLAHRLEALRMVGITPGSPQQKSYEDRLLGSNEPYSTFALANSLAGFIVGPLIICIGIGWDNLTRPGLKGSRFSAVLMGVIPAILLLVCLVLTKSRSAYVGLAVGVMLLAFRERSRVKKRTLAVAAVAAVALVVALGGIGLATGRLDRQVLTESGKSMRFRQQYWIGSWRAINASSEAFWHGFGPGNFGAPYVLHKLPEASEEISDPHDFVLEVWATAGIWAVVALAGAVIFVLRETLGPPRPTEVDATLTFGGEPEAPPPSPSWLIWSSAAGFLLVLAFRLADFFQNDMLNRWLVLGVGWWLAVGFGSWAWRRRPVEGAVFGAGVVAVLVNLIAAGGIGVPVVALGLWTMAAVGLNLRDDRRCGRLHDSGGRIFAFAVACVWVALLGTFVGAITPFWRAEAMMAEADEALSPRGRAPDFDRAERAYLAATQMDHYSPRPWLAMASMDYQAWMSRGAKYEDKRWNKIPVNLYKSAEPPRADNSWSRHRERALMMSLVLKQIGPKLPPLEATKFKANVVESSRKAVLLYPTNPSLHAWLAEASADIGYSSDAAKEGHEALRLDELTPHLDKKLDPQVRLWLTSKLPIWDAAAKEAEAIAAPKPKKK